MKTDELFYRLTLSWGADTALGYWDPECPPLNQCAPTALVVNKILGYKIMQCWTKFGQKHFYNMDKQGNIIDLTEQQFDYSDDEPLYSESDRYRAPSSLLKIKHVKTRYEKLLRCVFEVRNV